MKKNFILLAVILLLTGCKATANISIDKDTITETVRVFEQDSKKYESYKKWNGFPITLYYDQKLKSPAWMPNREKESGVPYYNVDIDDQEHIISMSGKFSLTNHTKSSLVRNCFRLYNIIQEDNKTIFSTSKGLTCAFNNFDIVVSTPYTVVTSNATKVDTETNTYIWNINSSNVNNSNVYLEVDFSKRYNEEPAENGESNSSNEQSQPVNEKTNFIVFIVVAVGLLIVIIISYYLYKKRQKTSQL